MQNTYPLSFKDAHTQAIKTNVLIQGEGFQECAYLAVSEGRLFLRNYDFPNYNSELKEANIGRISNQKFRILKNKEDSIKK